MQDIKIQSGKNEIKKSLFSAVNRHVDLKKGYRRYINLSKFKKCVHFSTVKVLCDLRPLLFGLNVPSLLKLIS